MGLSHLDSRTVLEILSPSIAACVLGAFVVFHLAYYRVMSKTQGNSKMIEIAEAIRAG